MTSDPLQISGLIALLTTVVISRILNERAMRQLTPAEKVRLLDGFASARAYSMIPLLVLVGGYWFLLSQTKINPQAVFIGYFSLIAIWIVARTYLSQRKMRQLELPASYRQRFLIGQTVSLVGVAWFFFTLFKEVAR